MSERTELTSVSHQPVDFTGMLNVAEQLVPTGFLPEHIKTAGQCVAIILAGRELGMEPMLALRSITMVKGKIVVSADAQLALFKRAGGRAQFKRLDDTAAVLHLRHPNGDEHTEQFSIEDARRAKLTNNPTWQSYPKAMLRSRCITAGLKSIGFEPTAGAYDPEEASAAFGAQLEVEVPAPAAQPADESRQITAGTQEVASNTDAASNGMATDEQKNTLLDLVEHPAIPSDVRAKVEAKVKSGLKKNVADTWIETIRAEIRKNTPAQESERERVPVGSGASAESDLPF